MTFTYLHARLLRIRTTLADGRLSEPARLSNAIQQIVDLMVDLGPDVRAGEEREAYDRNEAKR